ncbi:MAG TPA: elongation factor P [Candidatus Eisenbacteria bacterium]|nr:elongation factor P [Candidatus Eisenbacteria bacterium]
MISVNDLRQGAIYEDYGNLLQVVSFEHVKMGRGSATIKVKVKNLRTGSISEKGYVNGQKVQDVLVQKKDMQYLYQDGEFVYFMDPASFDQVSIPLKIIPEAMYLKEGQNYPVAFKDTEALSLTMTPKVELKVVDTAPGVKGNSASNVFKEAVLENGLSVKVPLFINVGDSIRVDTRTGAYTERA